MNNLENLIARYCFEVAMLDRCLEAGRTAAPYVERATHLLQRLAAEMRSAGNLPREEADFVLGEAIAFDPDLAVGHVSSHLALHQRCLKRLERECLAAESRLSERYDLTGPRCLELVAGSHQVLDYARGVIWAAETFGIVD
ncbi:MAG TPA: hypothetical protein V6D47_10385 [Oscillatoriaceae cyanobacterium]